jgi:hypothetical protein
VREIHDEAGISSARPDYLHTIKKKKRHLKKIITIIS